MDLDYQRLGCTCGKEVQREFDKEEKDYRKDPNQSESDVVYMVEYIEGTDGEGSNLSQSNTSPSIEGKVSSWRFTCPYLSPQVIETSDGWYSVEVCFNPSQVAPEAAQQQPPSADGGLAWGGEESLPALPKDRPHYKGHGLTRGLLYDSTSKDNKGKCPTLSEADRHKRYGVVARHFEETVFWRREVRESLCLPTTDHSPFNFFPSKGYGKWLAHGAIHCVAPLALEVPYLDGMAQESVKGDHCCDSATGPGDAIYPRSEVPSL